LGYRNTLKQKEKLEPFIPHIHSLREQPEGEKNSRSSIRGETSLKPSCTHWSVKVG